MMSINKLSILFYPNKARINKKGFCVLRCRLTLEGERKEFSTGIFIKPKYWNSSEQYYSVDIVINDQLGLITNKLNDYYLKLRVQGNHIRASDILNKYLGAETKKEHNQVGVSEYYQSYLVKFKKLVGLEVKKVTWDKFYYVGQHITAFIQWKFKVKDVPISGLDLNFLTEFDFYLKTEKSLKQVTINKVIQRFRKVIRIALSEKLILTDPFLLYKSKSVITKIVYLNETELLKLENYQFSQKRLQSTRDCFVFCCYTGLAYAEMNGLKPLHIEKGFDNNLWIRMEREKTGKLLSIPLLPKAMKILQTFTNDSEFIFPRLSNQKFNSYLKEIADVVGIDKRLTHHTARKTFATTVLLFNDVPMEIVSELLGHSSITITQTHYGKIVQKKVSDYMKILGDKL